MNSRLLCALAVALLPLVYPACAQAAGRVALVIGNGDYKSAPPLRNPANDADAVASVLTKLNFDVTLARDVAAEPMRKAIQEFGAKAQGAEISVVFYAGHAVQVDGQNYLIATDSNLKSPSDLEFATIPLEIVTRTLARSSGAKLLILDERTSASAILHGRPDC